ncbi:MAG: HIT family hydrolase [Omnitrophica WOR_2 bacterium SM23_29]|nr:MAG: HIT family hydrolase [Omnitrophica WOR_2 bacterium SM23_29]
MDNILWAPWRSKYIKSVKSLKGCIFCSKSKSKKDKLNYVVSRSRHSFSMLNIYPYNNGHLMVAPYRHLKDFSKLTEKELLDLFNLLNESQALLRKALKPDGYNVGINLGRAAGAGYKGHLHIHIVPRWVGDVNFMPIFTSAKVVSESLDALYSKLKRCSNAKR